MRRVFRKILMTLAICGYMILGGLGASASIAAPNPDPTTSDTLVVDQSVISDGQFVFGPNAADLNVAAYLASINSPFLPYADIITTECAYASVNPRVVLAMLEMRANRVTGKTLGESPTALTQEVRELCLNLATAFYEHLYTYGTRSGGLARQECQVATLDARIRVDASSGTYAIVKTLALDTSAADVEHAMSEQGFSAMFRTLFPETDPLDDSNNINPTSLPPNDLLQFPFPVGSTWWSTAPITGMAIHMDLPIPR